MGGDNAPREVVEGAILASEDGVDVVLVGDQEAISEVIGDRSVDLDIVDPLGQGRRAFERTASELETLIWTTLDLFGGYEPRR